MRSPWLTDERPLSNAERLALWRAQYEEKHPDEPVVIFDSVLDLLDWDEIPPFLRKQAG